MVVLVDFIAKLKDAQFIDPQGFCKAASASAKGSRAVFEFRPVEYKDTLDCKDSIPGTGTTSSPERRDGRTRSPYRGDNPPVVWPVADAFATRKHACRYEHEIEFVKTFRHRSAFCSNHAVVRTSSRTFEEERSDEKKRSVAKIQFVNAANPPIRNCAFGNDTVVVRKKIKKIMNS